MTDESIMPFGKHKGEKMANVPASYLLWIYDNMNLFDDLREYIDENRDALEVEANREKQMRQSKRRY